MEGVQFLERSQPHEKYGDRDVRVMCVEAAFSKVFVSGWKYWARANWLVGGNFSYTDYPMSATYYC